jgi:hypothetical protein
MGFEPRYNITSQVARGLMRIDAARQAVAALPLNERALAGLRRSARLVSAHVFSDRPSAPFTGPAYRQAGFAPTGIDQGF